MAKRRNKNKAKSRQAAIAKNKEKEVLFEEKVCDGDIENEENIEKSETKVENGEVTENDGFTEKDLPFCEVTENEENIVSVKSKSRGRKANVENVENSVDSAQNDTGGDAEALIFPREVAGETCIDIECGNNDAVLYLSRLCLGSKGACILHDEKWYTPNEFQTASGRETAKDWKRSIRHKGKSLKLLITKGLIEIQTFSPKKTAKKPESPISPKPVEVDAPSGDDAADDATNVEMTPDDVTASDEGPIEEKATSPKPFIKPATSKPLFKKVGKGRRGRKQKKLKQNVALVRPLSIQKPVVEIKNDDPKDEKTNVDDVLKKGHDVITDVTLTEKPDVMDSKLFPVIDSKMDAMIEDIKKEEEKEEMDTRTEEERRLDEFVKSLRLTKTVNVTNGFVKAAPELTAVEDKKPDVLPDEPIDSEMPVLQKEPIHNPILSSVDNLTTNVDPLQATVTPPPTPPSENNPVIRKTIEEDQEIETFKSRLSSPSNGLKLTINREKVKAPSESGEPVNEFDVTDVPDAKTDLIPSKDQNMQAFLLQDALQSARKYKEQLKQNKQQINSTTSVSTTSISSVSLTSRPVASVNSIVSMPPSRSPGLSKYSHELLKSSTVNGASKSQITEHIQKSQVPSKSSQGQGQDHVQGHQRVSSDHRSEKSRSTSGHNQSKSQQPSTNPGVPSMSDVMAMMPQLYGSLPFPLKGQESALAALQAFQLNEKMASLGSSQSAAQANLLHPMITQQLLMAMTQQLLHNSMYNIPQQQQQQQQQQHHHRSKSNIAGDKHHTQNSKSREIRHNHSNSEIRSEKTLDTAYRKRKHSEVSNSSEGVLDLSVKKPKLDNFSASGLNKSQTSTDAPIDFSLKRKSDTTSEHKHTVCYKPHSGHTSVRTSYNSDYRYTPPSKQEDNRFPLGCTCKSGSAHDNISTWSVDKVCSFLTCLDGCAVYAKTFREQGISGRLLPYLTTQHLTRTLGMKVGPALTLMHAVERKFREQMTKQTCALCRNQQPRTVQI